MMMRKMMVGAAAITMGSLGACDDGSNPSGTSAALSATQLQEAVNAAPSEVELTLVDGAAREVHVRGIDDDEHLEGFVVSVDADAGTVELDDIGVVDFGDGTRFRTQDESHASREAWLAEVQPGTFVRASRPTPAEPQAPTDATFFATDLRIEDGDGRSKIELSIDADNLVVDPPALLVLGGSFDLTTLQANDDGTDDQGPGNDDDIGDDHGGGGEAEPGDDHGGHGADD